MKIFFVYFQCNSAIDWTCSNIVSRYVHMGWLGQVYFVALLQKTNLALTFSDRASEKTDGNLTGKTFDEILMI